MKSMELAISRYLWTVSIYSKSPKNQRELEDKAKELNAHLQNIGRVLDVRWAASSFRTVKAVWNSYKALHSHFSEASEDTSRGQKEILKYRVLKTKLESTQFLCD